MVSVLFTVLFFHISNRKVSNNEFYGQWIIQNVIAFDKVGETSAEEAEKYKGSILIYGRNQIKTNDKEIDNVTYKEKSYSNRECEEYITKYIYKIDEFNIKYDIVNTITVFDEQNNEYFGLGGYFYVINNNTLIIYHKGVYFRAMKK